MVVCRKKEPDGLESFVNKQIKELKTEKFYSRYMYILRIALVTTIAALCADPVMALLQENKIPKEFSFVPPDAVVLSVTEEESVEVPPLQPYEEEIVRNGEKINLNTAGIALLDTLPGIGAARAENIVKTREKMGGFRTVNDLLNVEGIGEKILENLRDKVYVE